MTKEIQQKGNLHGNLGAAHSSRPSLHRHCTWSSEVDTTPQAPSTSLVPTRCYKGLSQH
jgi:hypothetical protein